MFACICLAVTCDEVGTVIDEGAATVDSVAEATGAGTGCGTCHERIAAMIGERGLRCPVAALRVA
jgi:bacterioferritin-associated ferredoxin